jgi:chromosome segregation ATPase
VLSVATSGMGEASAPCIARWRSLKDYLAEDGAEIRTALMALEGQPLPTPISPSLLCSALSPMPARLLLWMLPSSVLRNAATRAGTMKASRKELTERTKAFKDVPMEERGAACGALIKQYQKEIDALTKRGNKATKAYNALLDKAMELEHSASGGGDGGGDLLEAALADGGGDGGQSQALADELAAQLEVRTQELGEMHERVRVLETEKARHDTQLEQVTAAMEREALAKAETHAELQALREAEASRAAESLRVSPGELEQQLTEWQRTVAELQSELRSAHEQRQEWEDQAAAAHAATDRTAAQLSEARAAAASASAEGTSSLGAQQAAEAEAKALQAEVAELQAEVVELRDGQQRESAERNGHVTAAEEHAAEVAALQDNLYAEVQQEVKVLRALKSEFEAFKTEAAGKEEQAVAAASELAKQLAEAKRIAQDAEAMRQQAEVQLAEHMAAAGSASSAVNDAEARVVEAEAALGAAQAELSTCSAALADKEQQFVQSEDALNKLRDERLVDAEAAGDHAAQLAEIREAAASLEHRCNELTTALSQAEAGAADAMETASRTKADLAACRTQLQDADRAAAAEVEVLKRQMEDAASEAAKKVAELEAEAENRLEEAELRHERQLQNADKLRTTLEARAAATASSSSERVAELELARDESLTQVRNGRFCSISCCPTTASERSRPRTAATAC